MLENGNYNTESDNKMFFYVMASGGLYSLIYVNSDNKVYMRVRLFFVFEYKIKKWMPLNNSSLFMLELTRLVITSFKDYPGGHSGVDQIILCSLLLMILGTSKI